MGDSREFSVCFKGISKKSNGISETFQGSSIEFYVGFNGVLKKFNGCLREISK